MNIYISIIKTFNFTSHLVRVNSSHMLHSVEIGSATHCYKVYFPKEEKLIAHLSPNPGRLFFSFL